MEREVGKQRAQGKETQREATTGEALAQLHDRTGDAFLGRLLADAEGETYVTKGFPFEKTQENRVAIGSRKIGNGGVEMRFEIGPTNLGVTCGTVVEKGLHGGGRRFKAEAAKLRALGAGGDKASGTEQPAREDHTFPERRCLAGEQKKDGLGDVLGQGGIAHLTAGAVVNEVDVAIDELGERRFRTVFNPLLEQLPILHNVVLSSPAEGKRDTKTPQRALATLCSGIQPHAFEAPEPHRIGHVAMDAGMPEDGHALEEEWDPWCLLHGDLLRLSKQGGPSV